ncbi:hypothetical protein ACFWOG_27850 [Kitasatospora sp. NPDC058406]|uniref:hypothetical protein n=1 Tax=Kitasatospora sp. NPDC058406 TaxID=3346483 RepID=UPI00364E0F3D
MSVSGTAHPRIMPTERMGPRRQLTMIEVTADLGGPDRRPVAAADIARRLNLSESTVAGAPGFLAQAGLLEPGRGAWAVTPAGATLADLRRSEPTRARLFLHRHWRGTWFQQAAVRLLAHGPMEEADLAAKLGEGTPGVPERGLYLVEWLGYALIVHRDDDGRIALFVGAAPAFTDTGNAPCADRTASAAHAGPAGTGPSAARAKPRIPGARAAGAAPADRPAPTGTGPSAGHPAPTPEPAPGPVPGPGALAVLDPLMAGSVEGICALPDDRFVALMTAYRAFYAALPPAPGPAGT